MWCASADDCSQPGAAGELVPESSRSVDIPFEPWQDAAMKRLFLQLR